MQPHVFPARALPSPTASSDEINALKYSRYFAIIIIVTSVQYCYSHVAINSFTAEFRGKRWRAQSDEHTHLLSYRAFLPIFIVKLHIFREFNPSNAKSVTGIILSLS